MKVKMHDLNMILEGTDALYHEASKKLGLSDAQMCILYNIYEHGDGCPQKELYKSTGISKSTINSAIKNMEREGYVALKAIDGRSTGIYVTQKGHNLMADTVEKLIEIENRVFFIFLLFNINLFVVLIHTKPRCTCCEASIHLIVPLHRCT